MNVRGQRAEGSQQIAERTDSNAEAARRPSLVPIVDDVLEIRSALRLFVAYPRRALEGDSYRPRLILTEPGLDYRFVLP
jgi:hypothetical protein